MKIFQAASKIELNDLPKFSIWPSRLLGLASWSIPVRNVEKVDREYDKEKYGKALALLREKGADQFTPDDLLLQIHDRVPVMKSAYRRQTLSF